MSGSGMPSGGGQTRQAAMIGANAVLGDMNRTGLSPRQQQLNRLWSYYTCTQYAARKVAWDGGEYLEGTAKDAVATAGYIPSGFYAMSGQMTPLAYRRPTAPYHLCKVIVDRFTGLLFSQKRHPRVHLAADPRSEDFAQALVDEARLWPAMIQARTFGGGMGSVAVGFQFMDGVPYVEVHDPRFIHPDFYDRTTLKLRSLEKRFIYDGTEIYDPKTKKWITPKVWYRRVIDEQYDTIFRPAPVVDGQDPDWQIEVQVAHGFGFCPAVWIQNLPVQGEIDGEPDCHGIYDMTEEIDALISQASRGTKANCDPTTVLSTDEEVPNSLSKGSSNAVVVPANGSVNYLEMSGSGITAAREQAQDLRKMALEVAQCVLEHPDTAQKTATEVERAYSSMLSKADVLREQYGERGVKPLVNMMLMAASKVMGPRPMNGKIVRGKIDLPPSIEKMPDGTVKTHPRELSPGRHRVALKWPGYFEPGLQDAVTAVQAAASARAANLVDDEHAIKMIAEHFGIEDIGQVEENIRKAKEEQEAKMFSGIPGFGGGE